jgi:hypothetical protein
MIDARLDELRRRKRWREDAQMRAWIGFDWRPRSGFEARRSDCVYPGLRSRIVSDGAIVEVLSVISTGISFISLYR